jgi:riboflavin synthase
MFTGLVEATGTLLERKIEAGGERFKLSHAFADLDLGESISISGACLTVVAFDESSFEVQLSPETLKLTTLGSKTPGSSLNYERALRADTRLGGHLVTGHVDGMGQLAKKTPMGEMNRLDIEVPLSLRKYTAKKGSLTVDGVSLTVNEVGPKGVELLIIPHTEAVTTLGQLHEGDSVNLEVDLIARYVERLLAPTEARS